ncbi:hypothetical protein M23134_01519 [Microscilla marina ATCC 23134]|uniref:CHAT domain-containing protein n=1 Tax=Microscilla marina ATCC 23134 TaxID=313606 RepID=A1ZK06_MICM2|nr:hypothetical protein M23134_01519 [Microscilla marina ATCC 23134]
MFIQAIPHYQQAFKNFEQNKQPFSKLFCQVEKTFCWIKSSQYRKARELLQELESSTVAYPLLLGRVLEYQALLYQRQTRRRLDKALWCANRSLALRQKHFSTTKPKEVIRAYLRVAYIFSKKQRYIEALERIKKAAQLLQNHYSIYLDALMHHIQGLCYANMARLLTKGDQKKHKFSRTKGIKIYKRALELYKKALTPTHPKVGIMWGNIGSGWQMRHAEVHDSLRKVSAFGGNLSLINKACNPLIDSAFQSILKGVNILETNAVNSRFPLAYFSWYAGLVQGRTIRPNFAHGISLYQKALVHVMPGVYSTDIFAPPNLVKLALQENVDDLILSILCSKADYLVKHYAKSPQTRRKYLDLAWQSLEMLEKLLEKISVNTVLERDQLLLSQNISSYLNIRTRAFQQYQQILPKDTLQQMGERVLRVIEKRKKEALWKNIYSKVLRRKALLPVENQKKAVFLQQQAVFQARQVALSTPGTLERLQAMDSVSKYRTLLADHEEYLRQNYPAYRRLISQTTHLSLTKIQQQLLPHQALVSYTSNLHLVFVTTKNTLTFKNLTPGFEYIREHDKELRKKFNAFNNSLTNTQKGRERMTRNWAKTSHQLYQLIFKPVAKMLPQNITSLIILPSQSQYEAIPFEALLQAYDTTQKAQANIKQYSLINRYTIAYAPSLSYLQPQQNKTSQRQKSDLVAQFLAPIHFGKSQKAASNRGQMQKIRKLRHFSKVASLDSLPHTEREIQKCQEVLARKYGAKRIKTWKGARATESRLKTSLHQPTRIVHLATHAVSSTLSFELSKLFLYPESSKIDSLDGISYYGDIAGMRKATANLVVLSACETGVGLDIGVEGMLSLHRAFLQMGVPKVVHTQWAVHDEATAELMIKFYEYLSQGHKEAEALSLAKRYLLHNKIKSKGQTYATYPPYYWAAFRLTQQVFD